MRELERLRRLSRELLVLSLTGPDVSRWTVDRMLVSLDERHVPAGATVVEAGALPETIFFMREGEVAFGPPGGPAFALSGRWVFGALDVLAARPYRLTATARTDLDLVTLNGDRWLEVLEDRDENGGRFLRTIANELAR